MRKIVLGRTNLRVSAVGMGGIPLQRCSEPEAVRIVRRALDLGVTFIDTANAYTDSQTKIGKAIRGRRDGLVLATKSGSRTKERAGEDIERSLRELGVEAIDLFQFHGVSSLGDWKTIAGPGGALEAVEEARRKGRIAHVGFSTHSPDVALALLEEPVLETIQYPFNLVAREVTEQVIPKARERHAGFIVMKPLCGGMFPDAALAFRFLNGYPDLVPIPGIQAEGEIEEIVAVVESGEAMDEADLKAAEVHVRKLGTTFCRFCQYCEPCPHEVPVSIAMHFESILQRMGPSSGRRFAGPVAEKAARCAACGECEAKCPFKLPIRATVKRAGELARQLLAS